MVLTSKNVFKPLYQVISIQGKRKKQNRQQKVRRKEAHLHHFLCDLPRHRHPLLVPQTVDCWAVTHTNNFSPDKLKWVVAQTKIRFYEKSVFVFQVLIEDHQVSLFGLLEFYGADDPETSKYYFCSVATSNSGGCFCDKINIFWSFSFSVLLRTKDKCQGQCLD